MNEAFGLILGFHAFAALLVLGGVGFRILHHLLDIGVGKTTGSLDADLLFLAGALVLGRDLHDAVGVDVEGHFDLRHAARSRGQADEVELAEQLVVRSHFAFALRNTDGHGLLVVFRRREHLALLGRDRGVAFDQAGKHATQRFDAKRERGHVEKQHVLDIALQNAGLNGGTHGNHFIRVHALVRFLAEQLLYGFLNLRHAAHAAHKHHFIDFSRGDARILERCLAGCNGALDEIIHQAFELGAGELHGQVLGTGGIRRDERQVDFGLLRGRKLDLRLFGGFLQTLKRKLVVLQVDAVVFLEFSCKIFDETHVEVFTAEERVAIGGLHLEHAVADFQNRDIEGAAAKVINSNGLAILLVEAIGKGCRGGLVDDAQNFETGNPACILGGLALGIVEIGRNGNHGLLDLFTEVGFGRFLHLLQDHGRNLRGRIALAIGLDPCIAIVTLDDLERHQCLVLLDGRVFVTAADQALHGKEGVHRIGDGLTLCGLADKALAIVRKSNHRRGRACTFGILDDLDVLAIHDGHAGIRRSKVDTNYFRHVYSP